MRAGPYLKALAHRPEMLKNFLSFYASVGRSLDRKLYELIYIRVSFINGCRYCTQHHVASSKRAGLTPDDWSDLKQGNYARFSEKERAALTYAEKLTRSPHDVTDQDFLELKKHFPDEFSFSFHKEFLSSTASAQGGPNFPLRGKRDCFTVSSVHA